MEFVLAKLAGPLLKPSTLTLLLLALGLILLALGRQSDMFIVKTL